MIIRAYQPTDKTVVMELLQLNTPAYFAPEESEDFSYYLDNEREFYFVVEENGLVVACGGFNLADCPPNTAKISWDIFHPNYQARGWGSGLLRFRVEEIQKMGIKNIMVRTSQVAYLFYKKMKFELKYIERNYWAEGFDLYEMLFTLD